MLRRMAEINAVPIAVTARARMSNEEKSTNTFTDRISRVPLGSAVKTKDEQAIARSKHIMQLERKPETLLIRA